MPRKKTSPRQREKRRASEPILPPTCPTDEEVEKSTEFFQFAYEGQPPWDTGKPQPAIVKLDAMGEIGRSVLDVGCGTGENSLFLAQRGREIVLGVDIVARAIEIAERKKAERGVKNVEFRVLSAFRLNSLGLKFDTVIDCGLFHTFDDDERDCFVADLRLAMHKGSLYHMLCFSDRAEAPGPRHVSQPEIQMLFKDGLKVRSIRESFFETTFPGSRVHAWLATVEKV